MSRDPKDHRTLDLLAWEPPAIVAAFPEEQIRAATLRGRLSRAVAQTLEESELPRPKIAKRMGGFLGEDVSPNSLNVYASQAREDQTISALRLVALAHATGDIRPLQALVAPLEYAIVPKRFLSAIEEAVLEDKIEELTQRRQVARRQWKAPR